MQFPIFYESLKNWKINKKQNLEKKNKLFNRNNEQ